MCEYVSREWMMLAKDWILGKLVSEMQKLSSFNKWLSKWILRNDLQFAISPTLPPFVILSLFTPNC